MKDWIMELCPEIAEWQAELIAEECEKRVKAAVLAQGEPVAWMCSNNELRNKGYQRFAATPGGDWNIPVYTHPAPVAKQEPSGWLDEQTGDYSRVNRLGWSALYLHPAPVNTALLEKAAQLACDAVAFNGGSVQMEAHVRAAIAAAEKEMK